MTSAAQTVLIQWENFSPVKHFIGKHLPCAASWQCVRNSCATAAADCDGIDMQNAMGVAMVPVSSSVVAAMLAGSHKLLMVDRAVQLLIMGWTL